MRYLELTVMLFLISGLFNSASAQHRSNYRAVIETSDNMRYSGSFISINDSLMVLLGPPRIKPSKNISVYKDTYISFRPEEVRSIRINRKGGVVVGIAGGLVSGVALGLLIASSNTPNSGDMIYDAVGYLASVWLGVSFGGVFGSASGALAGHSLSTRVNLKNLDLKDFSTVQNKLERYQAKVRAK